MIIAVFLLVSSATGVTQTTQKNSSNAICLTEISEQSSNIVNEPQSGGRAVLWDNGLPDARNGLSCVKSSTLDRIVIDDFTVSGLGWKVNDGHFSIVADSGAGPEAVNDVWVYFFLNTGPCEPDMAETFLTDPEFNAYLTGNTYFNRPEIKIDVVFDPPVTLTTTGEWWVCFQPHLDENAFWLTTAESTCTVFLHYPDIPYNRWTWGYNVFADYYDVSFALTGEEIQPAKPAICCEGSLSWTDVAPGGTVSGTFRVCNCGDPGTFLDWKYQSGPSWPGAIIEIEPDSGSDLAEGDCVTITVTVDAPNVQNQDYSGKIKMINSDDPTDFCEVDITLTTSRSKAFSNPVFVQIFEKLISQLPILKNLLGI